MSLISTFFSFFHPFPSLFRPLPTRLEQRKNQDTPTLEVSSKPTPRMLCISDLPEEILLQILGKLSFKERGRIRAVNRSFYKIAGTVLWKPSWWTLFLSQAELDHFLKSCHTYIHKHRSPAVHMIYETVLAEKAKPNAHAISVLSILTKEKNDRHIEDLIAAGLLERSEFEKYNFNIEKRNYLCTDQVIVALFQNLQADYNDLHKLPDYLIKNLLLNHSKEVIKDYFGILLLQSIRETNNSELSRESMLSKCFIRRKEAAQNPWLMQICTASWHIPIYLTVIQNDIDLMHFLIRHHANTEYKTIEGYSLLNFAQQCNHIEIADLLQKAHILAQQESENAAARNVEIQRELEQLNNSREV